jgi:hypothetical protein
MREGDRPAFPPSARDAIILGGTVFDLLERERGRDACALLVSRLPRGGAEKALEIAFDSRFRDIEELWRRYLREVPSRRSDSFSGDLDSLGDDFDFHMR